MLTHEPIVGHWYKRRDGVRVRIVSKLQYNDTYPGHLWLTERNNAHSGVNASGHFRKNRTPCPNDLVSIDPGDGYRLVEKGEVIKAGDQWAAKDGEWALCSPIAHNDPLRINTPLRRRLPVPAEAPAAPQQAEPRFLYTSAKVDVIKSGGYVVQLFHKNELVHAYVTDAPDFTEIGQNMYFSGPLIRFPNLPPYNPITRV